ncbi:Protein of unknown function DUF47 [Anaerobranca californiensis DSM 14826]|uniref:Phosphate transport system protein n=1 Tax=Anaerobranca californiensis DSM 14826 TaxID=1120989 RepID=A0A1M6RCC0_9FIRM|nr:DUF47 family protein [Anaerobranca californiensis]SHK30092.1 Protein of unknown function DUF47 [Anaerobranca californiensis DSM 14826]
MKKILVNRNKELEEEIEKYLCCLHEAGMVFNQGINDYICKKDENFQGKLKKIAIIEKNADEQLKKIKYYLFKYNLIPDFSGDVLELLDSMDDIGDICKQILVELSIEKPVVFDFIKEDLKDMVELSQKCIEALIQGVREFFINSPTVNDCINKVSFYESEVDKIEVIIKRKIFDSKEIELTEKVHFRYFVNWLAALSDTSENIGRKLSVFKLKRDF